MELFLAVVFGLAGGFARAAQSGRLVMPGRDTNESGIRSLKLGSLSTVLVGVVAGLAAWLFNASPADPGIDWRPLGWALVAGFAGDIVLDYYTGQRYGAMGRQQERQETGGVIDQVSATANTTSRELERAHEERRRMQEELQGRIDELEAENEQLKKRSASKD